MFLEFFCGLKRGLNPGTPAASKQKRRTGTSAPRSIWMAIAGRFCALVAVVGIAAAAMFAASGRPWARANTYSAHGSPPVIVTPPPNSTLDDILAVDPEIKMRAWRHIVLHHSGTAAGSAQSFDTYHRQTNGWKGGLGYHFVIGNGNGQGDGVIVPGPRWYGQEPGAHANNPEYNNYGIGICLVGNCNETPPTPAQLESVRALVKRLAHDFHMPHSEISGHNHVRSGGGTDCPGKLFPLDEIRRLVNSGDASLIY